MLEKYNFSHIYDLQNSSRTSFYRKYLFKNSIWSSTETTLKKGEKKKEEDLTWFDMFCHFCKIVERRTAACKGSCEFETKKRKKKYRQKNKNFLI